jgi:hypothetical protein
MSADAQMAVLRALADGACRTLDWLTDAVGFGVKATGQAAGKLVARGLIERTERGCFQITAAGTAFLAAGDTLTSAPRRPFSKGRKTSDTRRERLWRAIRARAAGGVFSAGDLLPLALTEGENEVAALAEAALYCRWLARAGVLLPRRRQAREAGVAPGVGARTYSLVYNLGPLAPEIRRAAQAVYDPNRRLLMPCEAENGR